jgi:hypothetical protein
LWFWVDSLRARERALLACARACRQVNAQLLDSTVALHRIWPVRAPDGGLTWQRSYRFEYSFDGANRLHGSVVLRGRVLEGVAIQRPDGGMQYEQDSTPP